MEDIHCTLAVALLMLVSIAGCATTGQAIAGPPTEPVTIGATLALTGEFAYIGQDEYNGLLMAAEEINAAGGIDGRPLHLVVEDNGGKALEAVDNVQKLMNVDDVYMILSGFTHISSAVVGPVTENGRLFVYQSTVDTMAREHELAFNDFIDAQEAGATIAPMAAGRVAIIADNSDVCARYKKGFTERCEGDIIIDEQIQHNDPDFRTPLLKARDARPDVIVVCAPFIADRFMRQLQELDMLSIPTLHMTAPSSAGANTPEIKAIFEENHAISAWYGITEKPRDERQKRFVESYRERFGIDSQPYAAYFYDDLHMLAATISKCGEKDVECITKELKATTYDGISGVLSFDEYGVAERETQLIEVRDGRWQEIPG